MIRSKKRPPKWQGLIWPCVFVLAMLIVLLELGFWQLGRLAWKEDLIAHVNERSQLSFAPPAPAESEWPTVTAERDEYRRVTVTGMLRHDREAMSCDLLSDTKGPFSGPDYWVLTPLAMPNGTTIFVN